MGAATSLPGFTDDGRVYINEHDVNDRYRPDGVRRRRRNLRILCLHGRGSNNDITDMQINFTSLRDVHGVSCDCLEATEEVEPYANNFEDFSDRPFYSWFSFGPPLSSWFSAATPAGAPGGDLHTSLLRVMAVIQQCGPFDGLYGFSQGACAVRESNSPQRPSSAPTPLGAPRLRTAGRRAAAAPSPPPSRTRAPTPAQADGDLALEPHRVPRPLRL